MKHINKYIISLSIVFIFFSGCTKDLNLNPVSQISNSSFWKTEADAKGGLFGMYNDLRAPAVRGFCFWGELRGETVGPGVNGTQSYNQYILNDLDAVNVGPTGFNPQGDWINLYRVVHDANLVLKNAPGISFASDAAKNNLLAQAYTMRAFVYYMMVRTWGDLPLITDPISGEALGDLQKERTPAAQIFAFIKADLAQAEKLFSDMKFTAGSIGRATWSKPSMLALKGDVYLWTGKRLKGGNPDFTIALDALTQIETADVTLLTNFGDVFSPANKGNKEILMAVRFQNPESQQNIFQELYIASAFMPPNADDASRAALGVLGGNGFLSISETARSQFTTDDTRKNATFIDIYRITPPNPPVLFTSVQYKFKGIVENGARLFYDDVIIYRFADVLLMKAEAKNALAQDPTSELNRVRQRAYAANFPAHTFVNGSQAQNDDAILKERLFELIFENKRWWDLVRFNKAFDLVPSLQSRATLANKEYLYLFPFSNETLSLETKIKQNPGYKP
ncbi:MAG: RagB/SusD family nutrient uptake outer membrane protein [Ginsengibacter sp.]